MGHSHARPRIRDTARGLDPLERSILLTVLYSDLFDYPLTRQELQHNLIARRPAHDEIEAALSRLQGPFLRRQGEYITWVGREATAAQRVERARRAAQRWEKARRYGRWLAALPFTRMVGVCGSQAVENPRRDSDIDFFCITEPGRLWMVQIWAMTLKRVARLLSMDVCPNYFMTTAALEVEEKNLYTAHEVAQVVPLWGDEVYAQFLRANRWIETFLPGMSFETQIRFLETTPKSRLSRLWEGLLRGRLGRGVDRFLHWLLLLYYPLRLRRQGWSRQEFRKAYRRDRQTVMTGGYSRAVRDRFLSLARDRLGDSVSEDELERLFADSGATARRDEPDPLYSSLLAKRYGGGHG